MAGSDAVVAVKAPRVARVAPWESRRWLGVRKFVGYFVLVTWALIFIMPFALAIGTSFKSLPDIAQNPVNPFPDRSLGSPTLEGIRMLATENVRVPRWTFVSVVVSVTVTLGRLVLASLAGYALARLRFPGRSLVFAAVVAVLMMPGIVLLVPKFIVMKQLNILNTWFGLTLPIMFDAFSIFLMKQFFESLPRELEEQAAIDGAGIFQTFYKVMLPVAAPGLIALTILAFQGSWNEFLNPLICCAANPDLRTLPTGLALLVGQFGEARPDHALNAASLITTVPMAIIFFTFQRYFVQGVAYTGIKG